MVAVLLLEARTTTILELESKNGLEVDRQVLTLVNLAFWLTMKFVRKLPPKTGQRNTIPLEKFPTLTKMINGWATRMKKVLPSKWITFETMDMEAV